MHSHAFFFLKEHNNHEFKFSFKANTMLIYTFEWHSLLFFYVLWGIMKKIFNKISIIVIEN
jgi:hypothetical protein